MIHRNRTLQAISVVAAAALLGCPSQQTAPTPTPPTVRSTTPEDRATAVTQPWSVDATTIAEQYLAWGRLDDEGRWAPELCRMPTAARARFSESDDPDTHGSKLYTLYAKDPQAYAKLPRSAAPGPKLARYAQVLVKEAWVPEPIDGPKAGNLRGWGKSGLRPATRKGVHYGANRRSGLFLMFKLAADQDQAGTDKGWVYATLKPTGPKGETTNWRVTAAGRIGSCMECHVDADGTGGRLFGLSPADPQPR